MNDTCIYVVNHRDSEPLESAPYRLLRVGASLGTHDVCDQLSYDNAGDNISCKNFAYSELTGLYWIWKNTSHDITGLMHYRRFLAAPGTDRPLNEGEIETALKHYDCLVPRPAALSCSLAEQYCRCHISTDLVALMEVMEGQPERYQLAFQETMSAEMIIPCNIMIARKDTLDEYCEWLFSVLAECEEKIDLFAGRDTYQMRVFGFLSERLLLVWLVANDIHCGFFDVITLGEAKNLYGDYVETHDIDLMSGINGIGKSQVFEEEFYRDLYKDVAEAYPVGKSLDHYLEYGIFEKRYPSSAYSLDEYANLRPKLRSKVGTMNPEIFHALEKEAHWKKPVLSRHQVLGITRLGWVDYAPVYDWAYYTNRYDDVPSDYFRTEEALRHFLEVGIPEGRQGSKGFSLDAYKEQHPELVSKYGSDNMRYISHYLRESAKRCGIDWNYVR